jgi:galactose mutarotase-like enzyme
MKNWCVSTFRHFFRVYHPESGRVLEVYSNQPGVQFYTSNYFPENAKSKETLTGKDGNYYKHGALCLETQNWPDAPNHVRLIKFLKLLIFHVYFRKISQNLFCYLEKHIITTCLTSFP